MIKLLKSMRDELTRQTIEPTKEETNALNAHNLVNKEELTKGDRAFHMANQYPTSAVRRVFGRRPS